MTVFGEPTGSEDQIMTLHYLFLFLLRNDRGSDLIAHHSKRETYDGPNVSHGYYSAYHRLMAAAWWRVPACQNPLLTLPDQFVAINHYTMQHGTKHVLLR